jgi:hypothetical protein
MSKFLETSWNQTISTLRDKNELEQMRLAKEASRLMGPVQAKLDAISNKEIEDAKAALAKIVD